MRSQATTCAIVGGGPAGMVLGLLLARQGVRVTVLEKHADFLRDFRGDTVHPSTLELLDELGLGERFASLPHTRVERLAFPLPGGEVTAVDFRRLRTRHRYVAMVPQWDLLNLLAEAAGEEPCFTLRMSTEVTGLLWEDGRVAGVRYRDREGPGELRAELTVACDGRWSAVRRAAGLRPREFPVPLDVWWFRLPPLEGVSGALVPRVRDGKVFGLIPREGYVQVAHLIPKGADARLRARGLEAFRRDVAAAVPEAAGVVDTVRGWDEVHVLDVRLNRLRRWHLPGLLCIGDAAHAMSPAGGVGINLAVQDAVAAARLLAGPLLRGRVTERDLAAVRRRRLLPTVVTQLMQRVLHRLVFRSLLAGRLPRVALVAAPLLRLAPGLSVVPARMIGVGVRPERAPAAARRPPAGTRPGG